MATNYNWMHPATSKSINKTLLTDYNNIVAEAMALSKTLETYVNVNKKWADDCSDVFAKWWNASSAKSALFASFFATICTSPSVTPSFVNQQKPILVFGSPLMVATILYGSSLLFNAATLSTKACRFTCEGSATAAFLATRNSE